MKKEENLVVEEVYSPIEDKTVMKYNPAKSSIWKNCYKADEVSVVIGKHHSMYKYIVKFDGVKPVQLTKFEKIK